MVGINDVIEKKVRKVYGTLAKRGHVAAVYLFGSHATGTADEMSDIDLAVFMEGVETWDFVTRAKAFARLQMEIGNDVEPHFFPIKSMEQPDPASFSAWILEHGIRVV